MLLAWLIILIQKKIAFLPTKHMKCWFFRRGENRSTGRKTSRSKRENQQQTQPTYGVDAGIWTKATSVGGECSHHCATLARYLSSSNFFLSFSTVQVLPNLLCILGNDVDTYRQTFQSTYRGHCALIKNQFTSWCKKWNHFHTATPPLFLFVPRS